MRNNRVHPLFPTPQEIAENPQLLYSDHLPCLFSVPVGKTTAKIISWNILGHNAPSGFHLQSCGWETEEEGRARYERIINSLKLFVKEQNPDVIVLQEATPELLGSLIHELPEWTIRNTNNGPVSLFRSKDQGGKLEIKDYEYSKPAYHQIDTEDPKKPIKIYMQACQSMLFGIDGHLLKINNVHTAFHATPEIHEVYYENLLNREPKGTVTVVVGDTNSRRVPVDTSPQNVATGTVPMCFNAAENVSSNHQRTDFPDAALMSDESRKITQVERKVLDYKTGKIFDPGLSSEAGPSQINPQWYQFRMTMRLADPNEEKLVKFENYLIKYFEEVEGKNVILVRSAAKDNNERGFGLRFSKNSNIFKLINRSLQNEFQNDTDNFQLETRQLTHMDDLKHEMGAEYRLIFIHKSKMQELYNVIEPVINALRQIDQRIGELESSWKNPFLRSGKDKIESLRVLRADILRDMGDKDLSQIISDWKTATKTVNGVAKSNDGIMSEKRNVFYDTGLYNLFCSNTKSVHTTTEDCIGEMKNFKAAQLLQKN